MKVKVDIRIDNGDHPWLKHRRIRLTFEKRGTVERPEPVKNTPKLISWEVEGLLDAQGFDRFTLEVAFDAREGGETIFWVMQCFRLDESGALVDHPQDAWPRSFGSGGQPLLSPVATVAGDLVTVKATAHTSIVDLTDHILWLETTQPENLIGKAGNWNTWTLHYLMDSYRDREGSEVRVLGQLTRRGKIIPLVTAFAWAAIKENKNIGALVYYGPKRINPDLTMDPATPGTPKKPFPVVNMLHGYLFGVARYLKIQGFSKRVVFQGDVPEWSPRPYYGPTYDDDSGVDPNCQMAAQLSRVNRPMVLILTWGQWPKVTRSAAREILRFLWGQNHVAQDQDDGVVLSRFGIAGFSLGGHTAMSYIDEETDEVYLLEPNTKLDRASAWFNRAPDTRRLRLVSGVFFSGVLNRIFNAVKGNIKIVGNKDGVDITNVSWFPGGMWDSKPGTQQPYWTDYYNEDTARCHPRWVQAYEYFWKGNIGRNQGAWRAHQWAAMGGESGDPLAYDYRTFFGRALEQSGF